MEHVTAPPTPPEAEPDLSADERRPRSHRVAAWTAGLLLAAVSAVLGCRIADTDGITPVPQALAFLPWLLAPGVAALLLAALGRFRVGLVWAVAVLGGLAWFIEPYGKVSDPEGPPVAEIRVLASNVEFGRGAPGLIKTIRERKPDLVFASECDAACAGKLRAALPNAAYPYRQAVSGNGADGSLILSNLPLKPAAGVRGTLGMPGAVADVKGIPVRLQLAHPMPPTPGDVDRWRTELGRLRDFASAGNGQPTLLAGDFNATQDHAAFRHILDTGLRDAARLADAARTPSWPTSLPRPFGTQIDHVLATDDFAAHNARFLEIGDTDHRALLVDLTLHRQPS
ncbi:endonuclease/exonuclease/phosphatase family protein [Streptomyces flavofungini]|uniref:Endonuclease/exonuclease/phosphatase family protein n=1 Tax=Streptomyces flavofungini TaxID=68200 RepID=A0ABS0WXZ4_9ACTN|nr:endonuclease/exonuclease/phosphatase family protein [Streptomyces flavofungini]MBJ3805796.1 endonuclease/exonuclease/phosphatase family protein [Streptomyces flavofungini]GHC71699.1 membrane protein [Streptomyces flavofungini]